MELVQIRVGGTCMQALDGGGNFSAVAAAHARRCQQEFEAYLQQLVPWLHANEPVDSLQALQSMLAVWKASSEGQQLTFDGPCLGSNQSSAPAQAQAARDSIPAQDSAVHESAFDDIDVYREEQDEELDVQRVRSLVTLLNATLHIVSVNSQPAMSTCYSHMHAGAG